ncbi:MAG TPA: polysaccharide pyruvyl transferase family protein [Allosphingosinicella sp.]
MKIVITNVVALNSGDAAILKGVIRTLEQAFGRCEIVVLDRQSEVSRRYYPELDLRQMYIPRLHDGPLARFAARIGLSRPVTLLRFGVCLAAGALAPLRLLLPPQARSNLAAFRSADLVVSTGGTYLVEHYNISEKFVQLALMQASGAPTVLFTQSLGPFRSRPNIWRVRETVRHFGLVLLRDQRSLDHLRAIAAEGSDAHVVADAAFALADEEHLSAAARRRLAAPLRVAVSVRDWSFPGSPDPEQARSRYLQALGAAVSHLVRAHGARVTLISTCQGVPEYWTDDSAVAAAIAATLPEDVRASVELDRAFHAPETLIETLAGFDFVLATRMHMAILSLCSGTPVLPIAYEFKTLELFRRLGLGDLVSDIEAVGADVFPSLLDRFIAALSERQPALMEAVLEQRSSALGVVERLRALAPGADG